VDFFRTWQSTTMGEIWGRHIFWIWEKDQVSTVPCSKSKALSLETLFVFEICDGGLWGEFGNGYRLGYLKFSHKRPFFDPFWFARVMAHSKALVECFINLHGRISKFRRKRPVLELPQLKHRRAHLAEFFKLKVYFFGCTGDFLTNILANF
jgi:hypothetical protein